MPRQSVEGAIYCEKGLDADKISEFVNSGKFLADYQAEGVVHITNEELLTTKCDVLIPAASENQITEENAAKLNCRYVVEAANGPTTAAADKILKDRGITLILDIFASSGGVVVSYFE